MKPLETIVAGVITAAVLVSGCTKTNVSSTQSEQPSSAVQKYSLSSSSIKLKKIESSEISTVDQLIETTQDYQDYLDFRRKYGGYTNLIVKYVGSNNFKGVEGQIKELAAKLDGDTSKYAQEYLEKVKNFNYILIEKYDITENTVEESFNPLGAAASTISLAGYGFAVIFDAVALFSGEEVTATQGFTEALIENGISRKKSSKEIGVNFNVTEINPFRGTKKTIYEKVPYERIEELIEKYKSK